ncbi:MAG: TonB-dependent receptor [Candidatus Omnitrophota bacterium]|nr:MAG: TonB-dependent receptor [Candidatus Omnitrophota bacterium]
MKTFLFASMIFLSAFSFCFAEEVELGKISIKKGLPEEGLPAFSLEEMIDYSSSIDLRKRSISGVQQDVSLRGSIFEDTSIELGGIKINDPQTGHFNLEIPLTSADLEEIDIFKNSQKINFIPKKPKDEGFLLKSSFGEHALWGQLLSFNFPLKETKNRISCEHKISKGDRQDTDFEIYNFSFHSLWEDELKDKDIEFLFGSTKRDFGADSFYASAWPHEEEHITQRFYSLRAGLKNKELFDLNNTFYLRRHGDKYILNRHDPSFYTNYHTTYLYGLKSKLDFYNDLSLIFNIDRETIDSTNLNKHYRMKKGLRLGLKDKELGKLLVDFSGGFDYYEEWEYLEDISLGLNYFLKDDLKLGFSFDRIWRAPSFTELYYNSPSNIGNVNLDVQKSYNFEWGLDYAPGDNFISSVSFFLRDQSNTIDWVKNVSALAWEAMNVEDLDVYGLDFYSQLNFKDNILKKCSLEYTYLDLDKNNPYNFSKYVFDYNRHKLVSILGLDFGGISTNVIGNFSRPLQRKRYTTFDLKMKKELSNFTLALEGINIFDRSYQEMQDIQGAGRLIKISAGYSF